MRIELLYFDGCPNYESFLQRLRELTVKAGVRTEIELHRVESPDAATADRFLGSPSLRIDGIDIDPHAAARDDYGLKCRLYSTSAGLQATPPDEWVLKALKDALTA